MSLHVSAQTHPPIVEYFDKDWVTTSDKTKAVYYRTVEELNGKYIVCDYYSSNDSLQMKAVCSSVTPKLIHDGKATWYYKNGVIKREGMYKDDIIVGLDKSYYENGAPLSEKFYKEKQTLIYQYWSEDGKPLLVNGTGFYIEKDEDMGLTAHVEVKDSVQMSIYCLAPDASDTVYVLAEKPVDYRGGFQAFYRGVGNSVRYPTQARRRGVQGKVFVQFCINKKGMMEDAKVVKGIGGGCDEAALEACLKQQGWIPGVNKGKPVKMRLVLPITFKLG